MRAMLPSNSMPDNPAGGIPEPPPVRPATPDAADCCGEGCARCVFDAYDEAVEDYRVALAAWRARQTLIKHDPTHG